MHFIYILNSWFVVFFLSLYKCWYCNSWCIFCLVWVLGRFMFWVLSRKTSGNPCSKCKNFAWIKLSKTGENDQLRSTEIQEPTLHSADVIRFQSSDCRACAFASHCFHLIKSWVAWASCPDCKRWLDLLGEQRITADQVEETGPQANVWAADTPAQIEKLPKGSKHSEVLWCFVVHKE